MRFGGEMRRRSGWCRKCRACLPTRASRSASFRRPGQPSLLPPPLLRDRQRHQSGDCWSRRQSTPLRILRVRWLRLSPIRKREKRDPHRHQPDMLLAFLCSRSPRPHHWRDRCVNVWCIATPLRGHAKATRALRRTSRRARWRRPSDAKPRPALMRE